MTKIKAALIDQRLLMRSIPVIASGDIGTDSLEISLDEKWELGAGITYYANIYKITPQTGVSVALTEADGVYSCIIPSEMLTSAGQFSFAVFARNVAENIVKTSTPCKIRVLQGAYTGAPIAINWQAWKSELITALNEKFGAELAFDAVNEDIISAINALENADEVKSFFISALNSAASVFGEDISLTQLDSSMTDAQLTSAVENNYSALANVVRWYLSMQSEVIETLGYLDTESEFGFGIDYDSTQTAHEVKNLVANLVNKYSELADGIIGVFPDDGEFGTDPVPNIIAAVSALVTQKDEIINGMYSLYTGGSNDNA